MFRRKVNKFRSRIFRNIDQYGFKIKEIESLGDISLSKKIHYIYQKVDFLYNPTENSSKLVILFHGARAGQKLPIFRGFNYKNKNTSSLSISDPFLKHFEKTKMAFSWYLDSKQVKFHTPLVQIIGKIIQLNEKGETFFIGSSTGCYPALKFSSIFKQNVIISNAQLYLYKNFFWDKMICHYDKNDVIEEPLNIEGIFDQYGFPKSIRYYMNRKDSYHYENHFVPFKEYIIKNDLESIVQFELFTHDDMDENTSQHNIIYPKEESIRSIIDSL